LPGLEYVSIFASIEYSFLSSSIVKEIAEHGGDVEGLGLVPAPVGRRLRERQRVATAAPRG
jgi:pantetheine-phosphate adenylyltransferase